VADPAFDGDVRRATALLDQYGPWLERYHGGLPLGWMASIMLHESGGNFAAPGDPSLGEVGYYQIASYVPPLFGYDASARMDPETNVALAVLEYELEAVLWSLAFPDSWKLARLAFAVGRAGSHQLASATRAAQGSLTFGHVYDDIARWAAATGAMPLGSQGADKVAKRVIDIDRQWRIGEAVSADPPGLPMIIPDPPAGPYTLPADVAPYFVEPFSGTILLVLGGLALGYLLLTRQP